MEHTVSPSGLTPATAGLSHDGWMAAAAEEYARLDTLLAGLGDADWLLPTDCDGWAVRDVVAHLAGAAEATASLRESGRQALAARRRHRAALLVDGMSAVQVAERAGLAPVRLRAQLSAAATRGVRARSRWPAPLRGVRVPFGPPLGWRPLGYLTDRIYTRDAWMHRIDIARATGRSLHLTASHDGRLVADVVAEWAGDHGQPFRLELTGPAGGAWQRGTGGPVLVLDAVELARVLSGRAPAPHPLLGHQVAF